jgi:tight adherence protein B
MTLLSIFFVTIFALAFGIAVFFLRPTPDQHALDRRIELLLVPNSGKEITGKPLEAHLTVDSGTFPWLDKMLRQATFAPGLQRLILQSGTAVSMGAIVIEMAALLIGIFFLVYLVAGMLLVALVIAFFSSMVPLLWLRWKREKRLAAFNAALPDCIELCSRALRAGHSMIGAIGIIAEETVDPTKTEFGEVFKKQNYGLPLRDALMQMLDRVPSSDLRVVITGILVQKDTGGNLVEILDRIVAVIRDRIRIQGEIRTHTAQGRLTGWILTLLPVGLLFLINLIHPGYSHVMFHDSAGQKFLYAGLGLLVVGALVIRHIINGIEV